MSFGFNYKQDKVLPIHKPGYSAAWQSNNTVLLQRPRMNLITRDLVDSTGVCISEVLASFHLKEADHSTEHQ